MQSNLRTNLIAGGFTLGGLILFAVLIFTLGSRSQIFEDQYTLRTSFTNIAGLAESAPVRLAGKDVGIVESIRFHEDLAIKRVQVTLKINRKVQDRIRADSKAAIDTAGLLGDKYISITIGNLGERILENGEFIDPIDPIDLNATVKRGTEIVEKLVSIADSIDATIEEVRSGGAVENILEATASVRNITASIEKDDEKIIANAAAAMTSLKNIIAEIERGDGTANALIYGPEGKQALADIQTATDALAGLMTDIRTQPGLLHDLVYGGDATGVVGNLRDAIARIDAILKKIDEGEGTIGALVNDPGAYEDLRLLLGGARRSLAVRTLVGLSVGSSSDASEAPAAGAADADL